jgi:hypothetical protein
VLAYRMVFLFYSEVLVAPFPKKRDDNELHQLEDMDVLNRYTHSSISSRQLEAGEAVVVVVENR